MNFTQGFLPIEPPKTASGRRESCAWKPSAAALPAGLPWSASAVTVCARLVTESCLTLCDPVDCSPPGSSVHGILQETMLEWVAVPSSRESSWLKDQTRSLALQAESLPSEPPGKPSTVTNLALFSGETFTSLPEESHFGVWFSPCQPCWAHPGWYSYHLCDWSYSACCFWWSWLDFVPLLSLCDATILELAAHQGWVL